MPNECRICGAPVTRDFTELGIGWLCDYCTRPDGDEVEELDGQAGGLGPPVPPQRRADAA